MEFVSAYGKGGFGEEIHHADPKPMSFGGHESLLSKRSEATLNLSRLQTPEFKREFVGV